MKPIWIVDDDQSIRFVLEKALLRENLPTRSFTNPREVLAALDVATDSDGPQILVSDIRMPGGSGLDLLDKVKARLPGLPVIIMTAFSDLDSAVSAFQGGAFEYLPKPFDLHKAVELIRRAVEESQREEVAEERMAEAPEMLGQAPAMQDVFRAIGRLSQSMVTVMITGESGSGKELVARALHKHSPRANGPFIAINTAAIPKDLLESELFGHERGAFTGAQPLRRGRFEQRVKDGGFREDLFHRLNVIRLRLPALRERREDVFMLTRHFLQQSAKQLGVEPKRISEAALQQLSLFGFPGNVRQLENICHWLTVMAPALVVEPKDLPPEVLSATPAGKPSQAAAEKAVPPAKHLAGDAEAAAAISYLSESLAPPDGSADQSSGPIASPWEAGLQAETLALLLAGHGDVWDVLMRRVESRLIQTALATTNGRRIEAAHKLGIGRNTITRKIQELDLG